MLDPHILDNYMTIALREAQLAFEEGEVPIGSAVFHDGRLIGRGHNRTEALKDATAHAEMIALSAAFATLNDWRLEECVLVSTIEPCFMCAGAAVLSRIPLIVYGAPDPKFGGCESLYRIPTDERTNHRCEIIKGIRAEEAAALMKTFFQQVRAGKSRVH